ncbi:MAG: hypothetical protein ACFFCP_11115, partial [Promethearchaeota archaeon]
MRRIRKVERFRKYTYPLIFVFLFVSTIMIMGTPVTARSSSIIEASAILPATDGEIVAFSTYEEDARQDLDGDGYLKSIVLRYYDIASGEIVNTGLRIGGWHANMPSIYGS